MKKETSNLPQNEAMQYEPLLCAGLCDNCKVPKMANSGNGINEPLEPVLWCDKKSIIIEPMPKEEQISECECFQPCT